ncbi:unnamed protein product [Mytilus edulis]|uniref:C2H2-type domain-containing protein n=1 Tax=Mytilus edulis TaxID=6550 RepID=A0A8S3RS19_MYTED|nr:unnamed protein product [Mytilus edulis]
MSQDEVFLVSDWSMKYLPRKYREDQSDWFAKRGLPWHITMAFRKSDEVIESLGFVHIFQSQIAQDSLTTAAIIIDVINCIQTMKGSNLSFHLWSDNAGCYKSSEMMALLLQNGNIASYDFCESQNGKGPCDRTGATLKSAIRRFINQGNDVLTAFAMKKGIETTMKKVKYRVSVVEYNPPKKTAFKGIPAIGSYSNFQFEEQGIRVWKAHGVGPGLLIAKEKIPTIPFEPLTVLKEPDQIGFHPIIGSKHSTDLREKSNQQDETETQALFTCTNDGCLASFDNDEALTNHIIVGKCCLELDHKSSINSDVTKHIYLQKIAECSIIQTAVCLSAETKQLEPSNNQENQLPSGWALKDERKCKRFNDNQKNYLTEKFNVGLTTGRKEDPFIVSESMLNEKNTDGTRRFTYNEILSVQQITSFFSRMNKKGKCLEDSDAIRESEICKLLKSDS